MVATVIPVHNRTELLCRALESVLDQTHAVDEIVVVDDGSDEPVADLVNRRYRDVRVVRQPHGGVSSARNRGIRETRSDWIAFLDSDDTWLPGKIAAQLAALANEPDTLFVHCDEIWIRNGVRVNAMKKHQKRGGRIYRDCLPLCVISPSSAVVHRQLFDTIGVFDERLPACEDYDLWLRICARHEVLYVEDALVVKYGGHADQLSRRFWGMDRFRVLALEKQLTDRELTGDDRAATEHMLREKLTILLNGARKRENFDAARHWQARINRLTAAQAESCPSI